ncbi:MAG: GlsB/YeaQ/YmgE family stress response membrane protein [Candidatus Peribacteraceae bacterium]|nr:GlsB/YeaQ/YmgE family stress response membrane protein [Candidatus Peribacteraceae bacterium]
MDILYAVLIGIIAGWLAGLVVKGRGFGMIGDLVVGIIGAVFGSLIFGVLNIDAYGSFGPLLTAFIGAVLFLTLVKALKHA